jgi:hypothetical protein
MLFLANLVHGTLWLSALTVFIVMFLTGFIGLLGQTAAAISLIVSIMFVVALAKFSAFPNWTRRELSEGYQCLDFKQFADAIVQVLENAVNALHHQQLLLPLPDLDRHLEAIHDPIEQLYNNHAMPTTTTDTPTQILQAV